MIAVKATHMRPAINSDCTSSPSNRRLLKRKLIDTENHIHGSTVETSRIGAPPLLPMIVCGEELQCSPRRASLFLTTLTARAEAPLTAPFNMVGPTFDGLTLEVEALIRALGRLCCKIVCWRE